MLSNDIEQMLENVSGLLEIASSELSRRIHNGKECLTDQELYRIVSVCSSVAFEAYGKAQNVNPKESDLE